jgi:hypothetical protein
MPTANPPVRLWAALTSLAGIATLAITVAFTQLGPVKAAGSCAPEGAVIQFELARTPAELIAIFHPAGDPCRPKVVAAMDAVNHLDVAAYIPAYAAFGIFAAGFLAAGAWRRPLALAAMAAAAAALAGDYLETLNLLKISQAVDDPGGLLALSSTGAWIKFAMLALNALLLSGLCLTTEPRRRILAGLLVLPTAGVILLAADPKFAGLLNLAFFASWTPLLLLAIRRAVTGKG